MLAQYQSLISIFSIFKWIYFVFGLILQQVNELASAAGMHDVIDPTLITALKAQRSGNFQLMKIAHFWFDNYICFSSRIIQRRRASRCLFITSIYCSFITTLSEVGIVDVSVIWTIQHDQHIRRRLLMTTLIIIYYSQGLFRRSCQQRPLPGCCCQHYFVRALWYSRQEGYGRKIERISGCKLLPTLSNKSINNSCRSTNKLPLKSEMLDFAAGIL